MTRFALALLLAVAVAVPSSVSLAAQAPGVLEAGDRFLGAWAGASFYSPVGRRFGVTPDRDLYIIGLRAAYVLESLGPFALAFNGDVVPLAVSTNNPDYGVDSLMDARGRVFRFSVETDRSAVLGAGLSTGVELSAAVWRHVRIFGGGGGGFLWFTREMPVRDAARFNVTFEFGGGIALPAGGQRSLIAGYKFHHISNAYMAPVNPGVDGEVFYLGVMRRR